VVKSFTLALSAATACLISLSSLSAAAAMAASSVSGKTIVIDPGHGGRDPGAIANGVQEKTVTLPIGQDLASLLQGEGANVLMTRTSDVSLAPNGTQDQDLQARVQAAQQAHADAFVSIHANIAADPHVSGVTTFYGPACGYYSGVSLSATDVGRSFSLANKVDSAMVARTSEHDNGVQGVAYWVLGNPGIPAILVETAFLSNGGEAPKLADSAYQRLIADAIGDGLNSYFASGDATGTPPPPSGAMASCQGASPKDDQASQAAAPVVTWLQTTALTPLRSGTDATATTFATLAPNTYLKRISSSGNFLYVLNPATNGPGYVDASKVGPSGPPPPVPAEPPFQPFWVQNFVPTQLWSGANAAAVSFGPLPTWSYLQVVAPPNGSRLFVNVAGSTNVAYVDRAAVGPSGPPPAHQSAPPAAAPASIAPAAPAPIATPTATPAPAGSVTVAAGDTLSRIAAHYGTTVAALIAANHLPPDGSIQVGQQLVLPSPGTSAVTASPPTPDPAAAAPTTKTVTVAAGDTLSGIASRYGVSVQSLLDLNGLPSADLIKIGQTLKVST